MSYKLDIKRGKLMSIIIWFLTTLSLAAFQAQTLTGKVLDIETGESIPNCNILLRGTQVATQTNNLGEFTIDVEALPAELVFSHLNYNKQILRFSEASGNEINLIPLGIDEAQTALMQLDISGDPFIKQLSVNIEEYNGYNPIEKVYLHTDKDLFSAGEDLWYSGYLVLGSNHEYSLESKVLHIDLIDFNNTIILSQTKQIENGKSSGVIEIPEGLIAGEYQLRAYTDWMRNYDEQFFFKKRIKLIDEASTKTSNTTVEQKIDLQFFPEGGDAVAGINSIIAFKAIGGDGLGKDVRGEIVNSKGEHITILSSIDRGTGFFNMKPKQGERYIAILDNGDRYDLPEIKNVGYVLSIARSDDANLGIRVDASDLLKDKPFYIIAQIRQQKYFQGKFEFNNNGSVIFEIPKNILSSGVMTLTLFDESGIPRNERVVFINNKDDLKITTKLNRNTFNTRDKIVMDINVQDKSGNPVSTNLSLAVTDAARAERDVNMSNIMTNLLLESELKGHIESPGVYFKERRRSAMSKSRVDLLMLTNGWRRFNWDDINSKRFNEDKPFLFSQGLTLSGVAIRQDDKPLGNANLNVIAKSGEESRVFPITTKADGRFEINNINLKDSIRLEFGAFKQNGKPIDVKVILDNLTNDKPKSSIILLDRLTQNIKEEKDYLELSKLQQEVDSIFNSKESTILDEVVVQGKVKKKSRLRPNSRPSTNNITPDATIFTDDKPNQSVFDLLTRVAGISVSDNPNNGTPSVTIRGLGSFNGAANTGPLWILDGTPVDAEIINSLVGNNASINIERVEVLKGPGVAAFGIRAANGVILLYSRTGGTPANSALTARYTIEGYSKVKEFYSPKYNVKSEKNNKADYRTTLYWNANIITDEKGNASVTFYNSDLAEDIQISIDALSYGGISGTYLKSFGKSNLDK